MIPRPVVDLIAFVAGFGFHAALRAAVAWVRKRREDGRDLWRRKLASKLMNEELAERTMAQENARRAAANGFHDGAP